MGSIAWPFKNTGDFMSAPEMNQIPTAVNDNDARITQLEEAVGTTTNVVIVTSVDDFPDPVSNVITLSVPNTIYLIKGVVDIGTNRIVLDADNIKISGQFAAADQLIGSVNALPFISSTGYGFNAEKITFSAPSSSYVCDIADDGTHNFVWQNVTVDGANTVLRVGNTAACVVYSPAVWNNFDDGLILNGVIPSVLISEQLFTNFTGIAIELNGFTGLAIDISANACFMDTGATFLAIASNGANVLPGGEGTIIKNKVVELTPSTAITGYDSFETQWSVESNTDNIIPSDRIEPNGWGFYEDTGSLVNIGTAPAQLTIDALGGNTYTDKLPLSIRGASDLWLLNKIQSITLDDTYDVRVNIEITDTNGNPTRFDFIVDIGPNPDGTGVGPDSIVIAKDSKTLRTGSLPQEYVITLPIFTRSTFLANGAALFLDVDSGDIDIEARSILIVRTGSGAT